MTYALRALQEARDDNVRFATTLEHRASELAAEFQETTDTLAAVRQNVADLDAAIALLNPTTTQGD